MSTKSKATTVRVDSLRIERMESSHFGNPRYRVVDASGYPIGATEPDASLGYSLPNLEGKAVVLTVRITPTGRKKVLDAVPQS